MLKESWTILCAVLLINSNSFSMDFLPNDSIPSDTISYAPFAPIEFPLTIVPLSRGDLLFPIGNDQNVPYVGIGGGDYLFYPSRNWNFGFLGGFSFGQYQEKSFSGNYTYRGSDQFLKVEMHSRLRNFRYGIKVVNLSSEKRIKPYAEIYFSRMTMFTRLCIDERNPNESTPPIESSMVSIDHTSAYHFNFGIEIDLTKGAFYPVQNNYSRGIFIHIALGYAHGRDPVRHLDLSRSTSNADSIQKSDVNYVEIKSRETDFTTFVPEYESYLRFINLSFGLIFRI